MTEDTDYQQPSDAEVLKNILPTALNELVLRFKFKSNNKVIFGTWKEDIFEHPGSPLEEVEGFIWVWSTLDKEWVLINLEDIDSAIDTSSLAEGETEFIEDP